MVGYATSVMVIEGLKIAVAAAHAADAAEDELRQLERWIYDAIERLEETRLIVERTTELSQVHFAETLLPMMDEVEDRLRSGEDLVAFERLVALNAELGVVLPWKTPDEFDEFTGGDDPFPL